MAAWQSFSPEKVHKAFWALDLPQWQEAGPAVLPAEPRTMTKRRKNPSPVFPAGRETTAKRRNSPSHPPAVPPAEPEMKRANPSSRRMPPVVMRNIAPEALPANQKGKQQTWKPILLFNGI
jgi:hypothetical protein